MKHLREDEQEWHRLVNQPVIEAPLLEGVVKELFSRLSEARAASAELQRKNAELLRFNSGYERNQHYELWKKERKRADAAESRVTELEGQ